MSRNAKHIVHEIYSDVMFELAQEAGLIDQVTDDLEAISGVLQDEPEFLSLLTLSEVKPNEKAQIVRRVFKDRINSLTLDFLCVLAKRNRMSFLHGIGLRYQVLSDEHKHLYRIEVTLAKQPTDAELEKLKSEKLQTQESKKDDEEKPQTQESKKNGEEKKDNEENKADATTDSDK